MTEERRRLLEIRNGKTVNDYSKNERTPKEILEGNFKILARELEESLLEKLKRVEPIFFEKLVVDLLLGMGYGGSRKEAGEVLQFRNDEGIDGVINEDRLGLSSVYVQAKRWNGTIVHRPEIQKFAGALLGKKAKKGVFITTSYFSEGAANYAGNLENKIILIDGKKLVELMIEFNIGVQSRDIYVLKEIDNDYFEE